MEEKKLEPYQQRVVDERDALNENIVKLDSFIKSNTIFKKLPRDIQTVRNMQLKAMQTYSMSLDFVIEHF